MMPSAMLGFGGIDWAPEKKPAARASPQLRVPGMTQSCPGRQSLSIIQAGFRSPMSQVPLEAPASMEQNWGSGHSVSLAQGRCPIWQVLVAGAQSLSSVQSVWFRQGLSPVLQANATSSQYWSAEQSPSITQ